MPTESNKEALIRLAEALRKKILAAYAGFTLATAAAAGFLLFGLSVMQISIAVGIALFAGCVLFSVYAVLFLYGGKLACIDYGKLPLEVTRPMPVTTSTESTPSAS